MEKHKIRKPVVAGQFYPSSATQLKSQIQNFIDKKTQRTQVIACVVPHAGYIYSGKVAAQTLSSINIKERIILLGPNHTGYGAPFSLMSTGAWQTPLGEINIDNILAQKMLNHCKYLKDDPKAHLYEHSLEVQLPILQYLKSDFKIVPLVIASDDIKSLKEVGKNIAEVIQQANLNGTVMIVASSDMTHYEPLAQAVKKDKEAIEAILELNEDKLMEKIRKLNISMCGYAPVIVMLVAAKCLGAAQAKLIKYQTSGDVTGDKTSVVGYAGIIVY